MKLKLLAVMAAVALCGCIPLPTQTKPYHAILSWADATPQMIDEHVAKPIGDIPGITLQRTVAEYGILHVYLTSAHPQGVLEEKLDAPHLPEEVSLDSVSLMNDPLPAKPEVTSTLTLMVRIDAEKCATLGVDDAEAAELVRNLQSQNPDVVKQTPVPTKSGEEVLLEELATVAIEKTPQQVIREY